MITYIYPSLSSFIRGDIEVLAEKQQVLHQQLKWGSKLGLPINFIRQFLFLIRNLRKTRTYIISFAGYHSFLPVLFGRIFRKKVFIILNGTDSVGIKELGYGSHLKSLLRWFCKYSIKHATELWPVSHSLINGHNEFTNKKLEYGLTVSFPEIKPNYFVIPNGFDVNKWPDNISIKRMNRVVTVVSSSQQFALKGVDLMLEFALLKSNFEFVIVGMNEPDGFQQIENVHFTGRVSQLELSEIFATAKYYFQLSSFEGFGCSLCEAMLSGCIPIGSNVNAIPEIIGETGAVVLHKSVAELKLSFEKIDSESSEVLEKLSLDARNRVVKHYSIDSRIHQIYSRIGRT